MPIILLKVLLLSLFTFLIGCFPPVLVNSSGTPSSTNSSTDPTTPPLPPKDDRTLGDPPKQDTAAGTAKPSKPNDKADPQPLPQVTIKNELISEINTKLALENSDLDKFKNLNQEELTEVFHELNKKAPHYKKDFMKQIVTSNKLSPFIKNNQLDDEFITSLQTKDEDNYSFSNSLLEAALNDNNVSDEVRKQVVKKVFERIKGYSKNDYKTKLGTNALILFDDLSIINKEDTDPREEDRKEAIANKLKKIFALGDEAINDFYAYIEPCISSYIRSEEMSDTFSRATIELILEQDLLKEIVNTKKQAHRLTYIVKAISGCQLDHKLALKIRDKMLTNKADYNPTMTKYILEIFYNSSYGVYKNDFKL